MTRVWRTPIAPHDRPAYWQLHRADDGQFQLRLMGGNGEIVLSSELHPDKRDAMHVLEVADQANGYPVVDDAGARVESPIDQAVQPADEDQLTIDDADPGPS